MLIRYLLIATLALAPVAHAQEETELGQVLKLLQKMQSEQAELRAEIEELKAEKAAPSASAGAGAEEPPKAEKATAAIKRKSGWVASVHAHEKRQKEAGASLGRIIIDGFPMNHGKSLNEFKVTNDISYKGVGEIKIEEEGTHSFSLYISSGKSAGYPICAFKMKIGGRDILSQSDTGQIKKGTTKTWGAEIDLAQGYYKWEFEQYCTNGKAPHITWDLRVLTPSAMNAVSLGSDYIFHRIQ